MKTLLAAFCDDDAIMRGHARALAERSFARLGVSLCAVEYASPEALLAAMAHERPSLVFLDIDMPGMDGIELGRQLRAMQSEADIVYVTNLDEKVYEAFSVHPWGFVRKSRFDEQIAALAADYVQVLNRRAARIVLQDAQGVSHALDPQELMYVESAGKLQKLFFPNRSEPMAVRCSLMELERQLSAAGFIRIHKGFLANYRFIRRIRSRAVELDNGQTLPVGRDRLETLREQYLALMKWKGLAPRG